MKGSRWRAVASAILNLHEPIENKLFLDRTRKDSNFKRPHIYATLFQIEKCCGGGELAGVRGGLYPGVGLVDWRLLCRVRFGAVPVADQHDHGDSYILNRLPDPGVSEPGHVGPARQGRRPDLRDQGG